MTIATTLDAPALVVLAGFVAGFVNVVVGAGTLFTFTALVALGVAPLVANVSSSVGLVGGNVAGSWGYRDRLVGQATRLRHLVPASLLGAGLGVLLLLLLPTSAFRAIVPALVLVSVVLILVQPRLQRRATRRGSPPAASVGPASWAGVFGSGVYGGYFGAAQSVLLLGILGTWVEPDLQRANAMKNVLTAAVNVLAAVLFAVAAPVDWEVAGLIFVGATLGGWLGARVGTRLPSTALRAVIVVVGLLAVVVLARG